MAKKKIKPERKPRKDFAQRLAEKLRAMNKGVIDEGALSDSSSRWVNIKQNGISLCFSFDMKGEKITDIGLYQDVVEVVDQKQVWTTRDKK